MRAFLESDGAFRCVVFGGGKYVVSEFGSVCVGVVCKKVCPVGCLESVVERLPVCFFEVEHVACQRCFCRCGKVER